jgi:transposase
MVGYFEGIDSERGVVWRCSDSYSLRDFLRLANREKVPDHSWLSKTRSQLPHEVHERVFGWVLALVAERGLVKGGADRRRRFDDGGKRRAADHRDNGETYREMLTRMAKESGIATPTIDDLVQLDRKRKGKKLSNEDWTSPNDPDAKIARMKDGSTHLAFKPEHAVDWDTGVVVAERLTMPAARRHPAHQWQDILNMGSTKRSTPSARITLVNDDRIVVNRALLHLLAILQGCPNRSCDKWWS